MEQTLVNQFFPAVKNSFSNHPAKRRKVSDSPNMEEIVVGKQRGGRAKSVKTSSRTSRTKKVTDVSLSQLITAKPVALSSEPTSVTDQHGELKRKIPQKRSKKASNTCPTLPPPAEKTEAPAQTKTTGEEAPSARGSLKVDPWISEQAKLVLQQGRGKAALQASKNKGSAPAKSLKPSDLLNPNAEDASANKGNVREDCAKKFQEKCKQESKAGRGSLRQKYAHLLNPEKTSSSSTSKTTSEKSAESVQSSSKRIPAHQRYKHLVTEKPSPAFTLPQKYKDLLEMFRCVDSVLFLLHRRKETCTYERLKKSVQTMLGKKFSEKNLAQMKTVYPKGLIFRQERNLRDLNGMPTGQQLTIDANFEEVSKPKSAREEINQNVLITRRNIFESSLVEITKKFHQKFLRKLNLKIADSDLHRWHPNFKLDDVPDISEATLPQATVIKTCTSAKDMLEKTNNIPQVERALQKVAESKEVEHKPSEIKTTSTDTKTTNTKASGGKKILKGVSDALLERIKEKEMKNAELAMLRNPEQEKRLEMMDRLPDFVRILKTYFTTERKAAIAMEDCVQKLSESFGTISSTAIIEEHVRLLNELVPDWLLIVNVRKCPYLKLAKNSDVNVVLAKLASIKTNESKR